VSEFRTCVITPGDTGEAAKDCTMHTHEFDMVGFIIAYEDGELEQDDIVDGFQYLIDAELVWSLQGSYGRMAVALIEAGLCTPKGE